MNNRIIESILSRRTCRKFSTRKVNQEKIDLIVKCGLAAPSGRNLQTTHLLVLKDSKVTNKIRKLAINEMKRDVFYGAKTIIIAYGNPNESNLYVQDASCALENMFLAANALKLGSCWINQVDELLNSKKGKLLKAQLGLKEEDVVVGSCALGYIAKDFKEREIIVKEERARTL